MFGLKSHQQQLLQCSDKLQPPQSSHKLSLVTKNRTDKKT